MMWCPISNAECKTECAWFTEGECVMMKLKDLPDQLEELRTGMEDLEQTIKMKNFAE